MVTTKTTMGEVLKEKMPRINAPKNEFQIIFVTFLDSKIP